MKNVVKACIVGGALVIVGAVIATAGITSSLKNKGSKEEISKNSRNLVEMEYVASEISIEELNLCLVSEDVEIALGNNETIKITYYDDPENSDYIIKENGKKLSMDRKSSSVNVNVFDVTDISEMISTADFNDYEDCKVVVTIPENYAGSYDIGLVSGSIKMSEVPCEKYLNLDTTSGDVDLKNINCNQTLDIDTTSGTVSLADITVNGNMEFDSTSGNLKLTNVEVKGELSCDAISGEIAGDNVSVKSFESSSTSGDIEIDAFTVEKEISGDSISGSFDLKLTDSQQNYDIEVDTISGSVNIPMNSKGKGGKELEFSTTSGDVNVEFAE